MMIEPDEPLTDPRMQRVANLLGQFGLRAHECARKLRLLAKWYEDGDGPICAVCGKEIQAKRKTSLYCSHACRQVAYRRR